jgi:hypothetical protein
MSEMNEQAKKETMNILKALSDTLNKLVEAVSKPTTPPETKPAEPAGLPGIAAIVKAVDTAKKLRDEQLLAAKSHVKMDEFVASAKSTCEPRSARSTKALMPSPT